MMPNSEGKRGEADNPSIFAATEWHGIGLLPLNDEFRVHAQQEAAQGEVTLADRMFVLKPGAEYTAEWAVVPVATPDSWAFVNQARRLLDVNFPLKIMFAYMNTLTVSVAKSP